MSEMLIGVFLFPAIPTDMLRFLFVATPFCSCFVQLALQAQTGTKHERQCAPHDGSLATVCGDSRETALYQYRRFSNDCKEGSTNR